MKRRAWLRTLLALPVTLTHAGRLQAATAAGLADGMLAMLLERARRSFALPEGPARLHDALHREGQTLATAHLQRLESVFEHWVAEELAHQGAQAHPRPIAWALLARWANEVARWRLYSGGEAHDQSWWQAATQARACRIPRGETLWSGVLRRVELLPADAQSALLDGEREALRRWTSEHGFPPPPPRPQPALADLASEAVDDLRSGRRDAALAPMVPTLASSEFPPAGRRPQDPAWWRDCLRAGWWAPVALAADAAPGAPQVLALRYALLPRPEWALPDPPGSDQPEQPQDYPRLARILDLTGGVTVESQVDAAGRVQRRRVVARELQAAGIRGVRPVALETLLDASALAQAAARPVPSRPADRPDGAPYAVRTRFEFRLSDS